MQRVVNTLCGETSRTAVGITVDFATTRQHAAQWIPNTCVHKSWNCSLITHHFYQPSHSFTVLQTKMDCSTWNIFVSVCRTLCVCAQHCVYMCVQNIVLMCVSITSCICVCEHNIVYMCVCVCRTLGIYVCTEHYLWVCAQNIVSMCECTKLWIYVCA